MDENNNTLPQENQVPTGGALPTEPTIPPNEIPAGESAPLPPEPTPPSPSEPAPAPSTPQGWVGNHKVRGD